MTNCQDLKNKHKNYAIPYFYAEYLQSTSYPEKNQAGLWGATVLNNL